MSIYRIFPDKDTFITNYRKFSAFQTGSNFGRSQILRLFRVAPISGSNISGSSSRILMKFDLGYISTLTGSGLANPNNMEYFLKMKNAQHTDTLPSSYDVEIEQITRDWDEGNGVDIDSYSDKGFANWDKAKSNVFWTTQGGDTGSLRTTFHFDAGDEDLFANITPIVNSWLTGGVANNGLMIHLSSTLESGNSDYYYKSFHSKNTHFQDYRPFLEVRFDDSIKDDRDNFNYNLTGNLYLYNIVNGQYANLNNINNTGSILVKINDLSGTIKIVTASFTGITGIYSSSFAITSASYSGSTFNDIWYSGSVAIITGSFTPFNNSLRTSDSPDSYIVTLPNLKNNYDTNEVAKIKMFNMAKNDFPAVAATSSNDINGLVFYKGYYRVINDITNEEVIPFGTGSIETTRLSYNNDGNYFTIYMNSLSRRNVYRISFILYQDGEIKYLDDSFKFKIL